MTRRYRPPRVGHLLLPTACLVAVALAGCGDLAELAGRPTGRAPASAPSREPESDRSATHRPGAVRGERADGHAVDGTQAPDWRLVEAAPPTVPPPVARTVPEVVQHLRGLPFRAFVSASHDALLLRSPEQMTALGAAARLGVRHDELDDLSPDYVTATHDLERAVLEMLQAFDRESLSPDDRFSYDVYEWYLDDLVRGQRFSDHDYALTHDRGGHHLRLLSLLVEMHPLRTRRDAEDYVARLEQVGEQVAQVLDGARRSADAGHVPPRVVVDRTREMLADFLGTASREAEDVDVEANTLYAHFERGLAGIDGLDDVARYDLEDRALAAMRSSVVPAYLAEMDYLDDLALVARDDVGAWAMPDGDAWYAWRLSHWSTADVSPEQVHRIGLAEVARVSTELRETFALLGYAPDLPLAELAGRAVDEAGYVPSESESDEEALVREWEDLIVEARRRMDGAFDLRPAEDAVVMAGYAGAYYAPAGEGHPGPGALHVDVSGPGQPRYMMRTIAVHEAMPGHHYQVGLAQELDLPQARRDLRFTAFSEGWALYCERLAWEMGMYDDDPYGNVGRLLAELMRSARLVADTGIHARHWTREQARDYLVETVGALPGPVAEEVDRMVASPGAATAHAIAAIRILEMRESARRTLGSRYDPRRFHDTVIGHGHMPVEVLDAAVGEYVAAAEASERQVSRAGLGTR